MAEPNTARVVITGRGVASSFPISDEIPRGDRYYRNAVRISVDVDLSLDPDTFAYRLREARLRQKWSQYELAEAVGVTNRTISSMEANTDGRAAAVPLRLVVKIANALGVNVLSLLAASASAGEASRG